MTTQLRKLADKRMPFTAEFERYGSKPGFRRERVRTILLLNVRRAGTDEVVFEEQWLNETKEFAALAPLRQGDRVAFDARITPLARSPLLIGDYLSNTLSLDYKLRWPTKVRKLS